MTDLERLIKDPDNELLGIFYGRYTRSHINPNSNTLHVEELIRQDVLTLLTELIAENARLREYEWMYNGLL